MVIQIMYGTESGGGELNAEDIAESLSAEHEVVVTNMSEVQLDEIDKSDYFIFICSTYGEGELPFTAQPFYESLVAEQPNLEGMRYAMFGRGDTSYLKSYSRGSEIIDELLSRLGAKRVGEYGRHDAGDWEADDGAAVEWAGSVVMAFGAELSEVNA